MRSKKSKSSTGRLSWMLSGALKNKKAEGFVDTAVKVLIAVVIGALLLFGLYGLVGNVVIPTTTSKVSSLFNATYIGETENGGGSGGEDTPTPPAPVTEIFHNKVIPSGGIYFDASANKTLTEGETFPVPGTNDWYTFEDFKYNWDSIGWKVSLTDGKSKEQESYTQLLSQIANKSVIRMNYTFQNCKNLKSIPILPSGVRSLGDTFMNCESLTSVPEIPDTVTSMVNTFNGCTALTTVPRIPESVTVMQYTFKGCTALNGIVTIDAVPTNYRDCFAGTVQPIVLMGSSSKLAEIAATATNNNVTVG